MAALDAQTLLATVSEGNISYTKQGHQIFSIIIMLHADNCTNVFNASYININSYAHSHRLLSLGLLFSLRMPMVSYTFMERGIVSGHGHTYIYIYI